MLIYALMVGDVSLFKLLRLRQIGTNVLSQKDGFGHVAMQTDKYYMSFWPDGEIGVDLDRFEAALGGVKGGKLIQL